MGTQRGSPGLRCPTPSRLSACLPSRPFSVLPHPARLVSSCLSLEKADAGGDFLRFQGCHGYLDCGIQVDVCSRTLTLCTHLPPSLDWKAPACVLHRTVAFLPSTPRVAPPPFIRIILLLLNLNSIGVTHVFFFFLIAGLSWPSQFVLSPVPSDHCTLVHIVLQQPPVSLLCPGYH